LTARTADPNLRALRTIDALWLGVVLAVALAVPLHLPPIAAHGESREGLVVQDVVQNGNWVLPRRNGELPSKPPLFHWIAASVARVAGLSDAVVRSPSAIAAGAVLLATAVLGGLIGGRATGLLAAGALLGIHGFWESAWEARVDMVFAATITLTLLAFFRWYRDRGLLAQAGCYLGAAAGVLAKGPAGAALPGLVIVAFVAREAWRATDTTSLTWRPRDALAEAMRTMGQLWSWPLVALVLVIDVGWYAAAFARGGREFLALQLVRENLDRVVGRGVFGLHGGRSHLKILKHLVTDLVPWNLALVWAAVAWARGARADVGERFLHAWWIVVVAVFTAAYGKRDVYLLPAYPAIAILAGRVMASATAALGATRLFGVVPVPQRLRRRDLPARALLVVLIVCLDATVLTVGEVQRLHQVRKRSLLPFARAVAEAVPPDATLYAQGDVDGSDVQVLAYRLRRSITQVPVAPAPDVDAASWYLVRAPADHALESGMRVDAQSTRRGPNLALVTVSR
jgi:4-amino-4-deoxy-L-arabinose transferase-like glycosyltransferase